MIKDIDSAIMKLEKYQGVVYRSLSFQFIDEYEEFIEKHRKGKTVSYKSYTSASTETYDDNMKVQIIIESKNGRDMRYFNKSEMEIVFPRNTEFYIKRVDGDKIWMKEK